MGTDQRNDNGEQDDRRDDRAIGEGDNEQKDQESSEEIDGEGESDEQPDALAQIDRHTQLAFDDDGDVIARRGKAGRGNFTGRPL